MHIIAGRYKNQHIHSPRGTTHRPTTGQVKEALFSLLTHGSFLPEPDRITDARVLDLCCGTGAIGLEALSRGAAHVTFVDNDTSMAAALRTTLETLAIPQEQWTHYKTDGRFLRSTAHPMDIIYCDPPYREAASFWDAAEKHLRKNGWIAPHTLIIREVSRTTRMDLPPQYHCLHERHYGRSSLQFLQLIA